MKIRSGFVSNSSSSSFICDVCGHDVSGWDMGLHEAEMYECENGHIFCEDHAINVGDEKEMALGLITGLLESAKLEGASKWDIERIPDYEKLLVEINTDEDCDYDSILNDYEFRYSMPAVHCPICQMDVVTDSDMVAYLLKKNNLTEDGVKSDIKKEFDNFNDLKKFIRE